MDLLDLAIGYLSRCSWGELAGLLAAALAVLAGAGKVVSVVAAKVIGLAVDAGFAARDWWQKPGRLDRIETRLGEVYGLVRPHAAAPPPALALGHCRFTGGGAALSHTGDPVVNATFCCATHESARQLKSALDKFFHDHKAG